MRKGSPLYLSLTLAIVLMTINIALMVVWIILAARQSYWGTLTIGTIAFSLVLIGLSIYLFLALFFDFVLVFFVRTPERG